MIGIVVQPEFDDLTQGDECDTVFDLSLLWPCDEDKVVQKATSRNHSLQNELRSDGMREKEFDRNHTVDLLCQLGQTIYA